MQLNEHQLQTWNEKPLKTKSKTISTSELSEMLDRAQFTSSGIVLCASSSAGV